MTPAQEILKLIETVDPADTAKLDEIDARVHVYAIKQAQFIGVERRKTDPNYIGVRWHKDGVVSECGFCGTLTKYTRSRDALKVIRPEGWFFYCENFPSDFEYFQFDGWSEKSRGKVFLDNEKLPTEELAELHAIIQAIEYERSKG